MWLNSASNNLDMLPLTTFWWLESWYKKNQKWRQSTFSKFEKLKDKLNDRDPISYIYNLYYDETQAIRVVITTILEEAWMSASEFVSSATLQRLLFWDNWLNWTPRAKTDRTPVHQEKIQSSISEKAYEFELRVLSLLDSRTMKRNFIISEFQAKTYRIQKTLYVLKTIAWIDKEMLFTISQDSGLTNADIAHSLNKKLKDILSISTHLNLKYDEIKLYPQSIARWKFYEARKRGLEQK